jgi:hypothetical protein
VLQEWWLAERAKCRDKDIGWFDSFICTIGYALWKNRNAWCFNNVQRSGETAMHGASTMCSGNIQFGASWSDWSP